MHFGLAHIYDSAFVSVKHDRMTVLLAEIRIAEGDGTYNNESKGEQLMPRLRSTMTIVSLFVLAAGCGGSSSTAEPGNTNNTGSSRTMTATYNGTAFNPTEMLSAYLNGQVSVNATSSTASLSITAINVNAPGTYSFAQGNPNSGLVQWIDRQGTYSTGGGGTGTVTFTILQLGRVAGSFNVVARSLSVGSTATMTLVGTFDIKFP